MALKIPPYAETQDCTEEKSGASPLQKRIGRRFYRLSYYTGKKAQTLARNLMRAARSIFRVALSEAFRGAGEAARTLSEFNRSHLGRGELSFTRVIIKAGTGVAETIHVCHEAFLSDGLSSGLAVAGNSFRHAATRFFAERRSLINYIAPVASVFVLACTVYFWSHATLALQVANDGKTLGVVASESVYRNAVSQVEQNVSDASGSNFKLSGKVTFHLVLAKASNLSDETQVYDNIVMKSCSGVKSGYGLYVDNRLVGANSGSGVIEAMLDGITEKYKKDPKVQSVGFVQDVAVKNGVFPSSVFKSETEIHDIVTAKKPADAKSKTVATKKSSGIFRISLDPLYVMNLSTDTSVDQTGTTGQDEAIVSGSSDPTLTIKLVKNEVYTQPIAHKVVKLKTARLTKGKTKLAIPGKNGSKQVVAYVTYEGGQKTDVDVISSTVAQTPVTEKIWVGTAKPVSSYKTSDTTSSDSSDTANTSDNSGSDSSYNASGSSSVTQYATNALGVPYVSGGSSYSGFDCSGFTMYVYNKLGVSLPHSAAEQSAYGSYVSKSSLKTGDLVFFDTNGGRNSISHVGIYLGGGNFIDASSARPHCIKIDSLYSRYYSRRFMTARRVLK